MRNVILGICKNFCLESTLNTVFMQNNITKVDYASPGAAVKRSGMRSQTTYGLFLRLPKILNKQEEVFVYTKTLLAKDLSLPHCGFHS